MFILVWAGFTELVADWFRQRKPAFDARRPRRQRQRLRRAARHANNTPVPFLRRKIFRWLLAATLPGVALAAEPTAPAPPPLPTITGDAHGELTTDGLPAVRWRLTSQPGADGRLSFAVEVEADGLTAKGTVTIDPQTRDGAWELREGSLDLAVWLPLLAEKLGNDPLKKISATGRVQLAGHGPLRAGSPDGELTATLRDATLTHADSGLTIEGLAADIHLAGLAPLRAPDAQTVTFKEARAGGLTLRDGKIIFALPAADTLRVTQAGVDALGGRVELEPFTLALKTPEADLRARFTRIELAEIVPLLPSGGITAAQGRLGGAVALRWSERDGLGVGEVQLDIGGGDAAPTFRLEPVPGMLTAKMPEKIAVLPKWLGPAVANPVFTSLREIELGRTTLRVTTLRVRMNPPGAAQGRTLQVEMQATPVGPSAVGVVNFDLGVAGPLDELLKFMLNKKLSVQKP